MVRAGKLRSTTPEGLSPELSIALQPKPRVQDTPTRGTLQFHRVLGALGSKSIESPESKQGGQKAPGLSVPPFL